MMAVGGALYRHVDYKAQDHVTIVTLFPPSDRCHFLCQRSFPVWKVTAHAQVILVVCLFGELFFLSEKVMAHAHFNATSFFHHMINAVLSQVQTWLPWSDFFIIKLLPLFNEFSVSYAECSLFDKVKLFHSEFIEFILHLPYLWLVYSPDCFIRWWNLVKSFP